MVTRVLALDDESFSSVDSLLRTSLGYQVDFARDIIKAKEFAANNNYNAFIVEPFLNGFPNVKYIGILMTRLYDSNIPVIVTSTQSEHTLENRFGLKATDNYSIYLKKPYSIEKELIPVLRAAVKDERKIASLDLGSGC